MEYKPKKRILVSSIFYPLSMMHYFIRALNRRSDVELITVGPFTGNWIPWSNPYTGQVGMSVPMRHVYTPSIPLDRSLISTGKVDPNLLMFMYGDRLKNIDMVLQIDAGFYLEPPLHNCINAHIATDPHALNYDEQRKNADFFFNMQKVYMKPGDIYLPYAYDPTIHFHEEIEKEFDACLIGLHYEHRNKLVLNLRKRGLNVYYDIGPIYDEYRTLNCKNKVGLNWSSLKDLNARAFELPAMGICSIMNTVPDMPEFLTPGIDYLDFKDGDDAEKQVLRALADDNLRNEIALNGYNKIKSHTYDARVQQILETVGLV